MSNTSSKISPARIAQVQRMLRDGLSEQKVMARLGMSRSTFELIVETEAAPIYYGIGRATPSDYRRCRTCGGLVLLPCYACALRDRRSRQAV